MECAPRRREFGWQIPILGRDKRVIAWTDVNPEPRGGALAHPEAEKVLGGPVGCTYVEIRDLALAQKAGAPPDWSEPWRCLALVPIELAGKGPLTIGDTAERAEL